MSDEFHYPQGKWSRLKRQLPVDWIPLEEFLRANQPDHLTDQEWAAANFDDDKSQKALSVWTSQDRCKQIANRTSDGIREICARELYLERLRRFELPKFKTINEEGYFAPVDEVEKAIGECNVKFVEMLELVSNLSPYVRAELDPEKIARLEELLESLIQPRDDAFRVPKQTFREEFLLALVDAYKAIYGDRPRLTKDRQHPKTAMFPDVVEELCELIGISSTGIEDQFRVMRKKSLI